MSKPSMTLKRGSANSFFTAALRTWVDTPRATKREKSASGVNAATSAKVGRPGVGTEGWVVWTVEAAVEGSDSAGG